MTAHDIQAEAMARAYASLRAQTERLSSDDVLRYSEIVVRNVFMGMQHQVALDAAMAEFRTDGAGDYHPA